MPRLPKRLLLFVEVNTVIASRTLRCPINFNLNLVTLVRQSYINHSTNKCQPQKQQFRFPTLMQEYKLLLIVWTVNITLKRNKLKAKILYVLLSLVSLLSNTIQHTAVQWIIWFHTPCFIYAPSLRPYPYILFSIKSSAYKIIMATDKVNTADLTNR